jgi:hypothetical protein
MRKLLKPCYLFLLLAGITLAPMACNQSHKPSRKLGYRDTIQITDSLPRINFVKRAIDIGKVVEGEKVEVNFEYYNSGAADLRINAIETSCGCTTVSWDTTPVPYGTGGNIKVLFDSKDFSGLQNKSIRINSNSRKPYDLLAITAEVIVTE